MRKHLYLIFFTFLMIFSSCQVAQQGKEPPEHLQLGEPISFIGSDPKTSYLMVGYREDLNGDVEKYWNNQSYVVFAYLTESKELKYGTIHINSIINKK